MYRTDHAHRWERTHYMPMSSSYARTLYDDAPLLMTGETRPAEFGHTKDGDLVEVRRAGFPVDIDTHSMPLELLTERLQPGSVVQRVAPSIPAGRCYGESCRQGRAMCTEQCAEIEAARMAGAGMQEPSAPVPLAWTPHRVGDVLGTVVGWAIVAALAVGAWALLLSGVPR